MFTLAMLMTPCVPVLGFLGPIGWPEMLVIAVVGLLFFGKRLPEVGRSLGKGIVEFKKGLSGLDSDMTKAGDPPRIENQADSVSGEEKAKSTTKESA
ncbi:MAG: twin-arginine translocase TatA/TatE family subunit [Phycisphaeraceae bacterium]